MRTGAASDVSTGRPAVVQVILQGPEGITRREVPSAEFEPGERGLSMGAVLVPWTRVFRYELITQQPFVPDATEEGSRAVQRVVYEDEDGRQRRIDVPFDRFESGPWSATMVAERHVLADRGELRIRKISIPWHRIIETERIFSVPEARPDV